MSQFRYESEFSNVHVDACWLIRAGKQNDVKDLLQEKYFDCTSQELDIAITVGGTLNKALWDLSVKCWKKEIEKAEFLQSILEVCPELTETMVERIYDTAMFDSM